MSVYIQAIFINIIGLMVAIVCAFLIAERYENNALIVIPSIFIGVIFINILHRILITCPTCCKYPFVTRGSIRFCQHCHADLTKV